MERVASGSDGHGCDLGAVPASFVGRHEDVGGPGGSGREGDGVGTRRERGVVGQANISEREIAKSGILVEIESDLSDPDAAPARLVDRGFVVDCAGRVRRQVDRHVVASRIDDDVLRLTPDLAALVEPRKPGNHAATGSIGKAEPAAVADVDGRPVVPVGDQRGSHWELDERVVVERLSAVGTTTEAGVDDVAGADDVVATGHVPRVTRHCCVVRSANIARAQHTDDRRSRRRKRGIGAAQTNPIELDRESSSGSREPSSKYLKSDDLSGPRGLAAGQARAGEIDVVNDPTGLGGERNDTCEARIREELHAHVLLLVDVHRERKVRIDRRVDRLQQTIPAPRQFSAPRANELDRRAALSVDGQHSPAHRNTEAALGTNRRDRRHILVVREVPRVTEHIGGVVAARRECRRRRCGQCTRELSRMGRRAIDDDDGRQQANSDCSTQRAAFHSDLLRNSPLEYRHVQQSA